MTGTMIRSDEPQLVLKAFCMVCREEKEMKYIGSTPLETESIDMYRCDCGNGASVLKYRGW